MRRVITNRYEPIFDAEPVQTTPLVETVTIEIPSSAKEFLSFIQVHLMPFDSDADEYVCDVEKAKAMLATIIPEDHGDFENWLNLFKQIATDMNNAALNDDGPVPFP